MMNNHRHPLILILSTFVLGTSTSSGGEPGVIRASIGTPTVTGIEYGSEDTAGTAGETPALREDWYSLCFLDPVVLSPLRYTATVLPRTDDASGSGACQELGVTQISSVRPKTDGSEMIRSEDERRPWLTALEARFAQAEPNLSSSRQELIREILDHAEETYFLSSRALAKRYELDPTTIVRTIQALGYKRYGEFAADLRSHFVARITPYALMRSAVRDKRSVANHIEHTLDMDIQNLNALRSQLDVKRVLEIAKRIDRAGRIMVVGIDFAASLSNLLAYGLVSIGYDAEAPAGSAGNLNQKILLLGPKDLLIAISFGRCLQDTVDSVIRARDNGVPTFGLTDSEKSPIARFADAFLITSIASPSFHGSYVAVVSVINALLVACSQLRPQRSLTTLRRKEQEFRSRWYTPLAGKSVKRDSDKYE